MIQQYLKVVIVSSVLIVSIETQAMMKRKQDPRLQEIDEFEKELCRPSTPPAVGMGPASFAKITTYAKITTHTTLAEKIKKMEPILESKGCCHECIVHYFLGKNIDCPSICQIKSSIDSLLMLYLGFDFCYLRYTTWDLSEDIIANPELLDNDLSTIRVYTLNGKVAILKQMLEEMKKLSPEKNKRFIELAYAHHKWVRSGRKTPFQFSYNGYHKPFFVISY